MYTQDCERCAISRQDCEELWPLRPFLGDEAAGLYFLRRLTFFQLVPTPQPVDFFQLQGEVQGRSLVTFSTKLQMVEALRDPVVQRKYPNIAISKNSIIEK